MVSKMSREERAKQFMPFAALKGYPDALRRKEKVVLPKGELSEDYQEELDRKLRQVHKNDIITVVYFCQNEYIKLTYDKCFSFELGKTKNENGTFIARKRGEKCPHCGCELVDILVLDGRDERFAFLGLDGIITASCCPNCVTLSEGISNRFTLDGKSEILEYDGTDENYYSDEYLNAMAENRLVISEKERPLFYGAFNNDVNTIGGFANWVQDWEYRECPECGRKMKYLAQIHWDTIEDCAEGTLFIEICPDCKIITMFHQQT